MIIYFWHLCDHWINPAFLSLSTFTFLAHCILTVVFGLVGALIGDVLSREPDLRRVTETAKDGRGRPSSCGHGTAGTQHLRWQFGRRYLDVPTICDRDQVRRSLSSIQFSIKLAVATS